MSLFVWMWGVIVYVVVCVDVGSLYVIYVDYSFGGCQLRHLRRCGSLFHLRHLCCLGLKTHNDT